MRILVATHNYPRQEGDPAGAFVHLPFHLQEELIMKVKTKVKAGPDRGCGGGGGGPTTGGGIDTAI